ncbi:tryptophan 7-halogenase, partial [Kitasatospora purpeofusca]|uniref:tryptophan 7-halogenase n=1 Tax=Kitasatospora purpeofusca TaxID=67352 RepID=UPI0035DA3D1D
TPAALALVRAGRTVLLAHAGTGPAPVGEALPAAARVLLRDLGADGVLANGHLPCLANRSAWGSPALGSTDSILDPHGHGWHLDRQLFDHQLRTCADDQGAALATGTVARPLGRTADGGWAVALDGRERVHCRWIMDATGRRAAVATSCGARRLVRDRLIAVHLTLGPSPQCADTTTTVEAVPEGWWYTAPLPAGRRLLAWYTDVDLPAARTALPTGLAATRYVGPLTGGHPWPPAAVPRRAPAHTARLDTVHGEGWIAAGDAAAAFDPLSSQGILTALFTGMSAGQAVHGHLDGDPDALPGYARTLDQVHATYLRNLRTHYAAEQRWPDRPFWQRRQLTTTSTTTTAATSPEETPA